MRLHNIPYSILRKSHEIIPNTIMSAAMGLFLLGTQELTQNSRGKRAISVRATKVLLYFLKKLTPIETSGKMKMEEVPSLKV